MVANAPTLVLQIGCFFGFLTCDTPRGVWPTGPPSPTDSSTSVSSSSDSDPSGSTTITSTATSSTPDEPTATDPTSTATEPTGTSTGENPSSTATSSTSTPSAPDPSTSTSVSTSTPVIPTTSSSMSVTTSTAPVPAATGTLAANILVIARDDTQASVASSGLNGYGIPFTTLLVPQAGVELPTLNTSSGGNFGGIVVAGEVSYDYGSDSWRSALTDDQWNQLYAYQLAYGVRMVQYDVFPGPKFGAEAVGSGCCADGVEQLIYFTDTEDFPTSGLKTGSGAGVSTQGLWHYPASISDTATTKAIASFGAGGGDTGETTAAVINNFDGRQQLVFFIGFDTVWSDTSNFLQHAWITWITRGLHAGYRRVNLNTQIDDMFLQTDIYQPAGLIYRIGTEDMDGITSWLPTIRAKLNPGSTYFVEIGHNGNGNVEAGVESAGEDTCSGGAIEYDSPPDTELEFQKPLGTGTSLWPTSPTEFVWTNTCLNADPLLIWFQEHLNEYAHISHTFTHLEQNNATFDDVSKEISFNQAWLQQVGFTGATWFTSNGIIPPAITGLHNGDALRAWSENGITNCVGDNTRPALLNSQNAMWPYFTNVATDGFDGIQVNPRWSTRIYYNCDTPACTTQEWIDTSAGAGDFQDLLAVERTETLRHFFALSRDGYMFHQANLRNTGIDPITVNGVSAQISIFQAWVETVVQEFVRLVDWPVVTTTHQQMSANFLDRYTRDQCGYQLSYILDNNAITGVTVTADGNTCGAAIPVTFPTAPSDTQGFTTEQLGSDPVTVWAQLSGSPVSFSLASPIAL
ncbi:putative extracellular serine-rich protein [Aspergillus undulatus]|uniref:putative extracellular serine-rich protein n=1 Tax=Aspergillus undulatus TaxID=1810928 RepID=UPI003CCD9ABC